MQSKSPKSWENQCNLIIDKYQSETSLKQSTYHHYYYPNYHQTIEPSIDLISSTASAPEPVVTEAETTEATTINPVTINIIDNNNSKFDPDNLLPRLQLSAIMTGSNKMSIESLTNNSNSNLKNASTATSIVSNMMVNNNNTINNNNINSVSSNINSINTINSVNRTTLNGSHSNYTTTNKLMMKLLPWCKLRRKQFVFRDSLSCDDISSVMFRRSSVQPITGVLTDKSNQTIISSPSSPSTTTNTTSTSSNSSSVTSCSSALTMARLFTGKRNVNNNNNNKLSNGDNILSYTLTNRKRNNHNNSMSNGHSGSSISSYPMVSFINKGEGLVTVDSTFDRILMSNENELYSLGSTINHHHHLSSTSTSSSISSSFNSFSNGSSSLSSSKSMGNLGASYGPTCSRINSSTCSTSDCDLPSVYGSTAKELPAWFYGPICRDKAIAILSTQPIGSFLVRESTSKPGCYALSLRVPKRFQMSGVAHYLILRSSQGTFKIKGFTKEFSSLHSLIVHHSIMQELLPCPLDLSTIKYHQPKHEQTIIISPTEAQTQLIDETVLKESQSRGTTITTTTTSSTTLPTSTTVNTLPSTSTLKSSTVNTNYDNNEDLLVDIDSDPDYQRILTQFRKTMATCI